MRLPDFLIVGAARSGSTTLHEMLRSHPKIFLPKEKRPEPHFFLRDSEYVKGISYYADRYFADVGGATHAGESSTTYLYSRKACERMRRHLPNVRILSILRDPVERAFSHHRSNVRNGLERLGFSEAIRKETERLQAPRNGFERESSPFSYIDRGRYWQQLSRYVGSFGSDRVHTVLLEDLARDTESTTSSITDFLGVRFQIDCTLAGQRFNRSPEEVGTVSPEDRLYVIERVCRDVRRLQNWLGRDLSRWIEP